MGILNAIQHKTQSLDISNWKAFLVSDLFDVQCSKYHDPKKYSDGDVPYIARTTFNNGEIKRVNTNEPLYPANCITIGAESAKAFYQTKPFITGNKTYRIYAKNNSVLNRHTALFLITLLNKEGEKYNYSNAFVQEKIANTKLYLPVDDNGNPDWNFMEKYIVSLEDIIQNKVDSLIDIIKNCQMGEVENLQNWKMFRIRDIFDISTGATIQKELLTDGTTPRISVTNVNNGIQGRFADLLSPNYRTIENFISISFLGTCFYHPYKASLDMKVHAIKPKSYVLNIFSGLFIVSVIRKLYKSSYADQISSSDLKNMDILLPYNFDNNTPDWTYMENYIRSKYDNIKTVVL